MKDNKRRRVDVLLGFRQTYSAEQHGVLSGVVRHAEDRELGSTGTTRYVNHVTLTCVLIIQVKP